MRSQYCGLVSRAQLGLTVTLYGWVHRRRDHGGVIFIDLRDREGLVQIVCDPDNPVTFATADRMRNEFVVKAVGRVRERPAGTVNPNLVSGEIEVLAQELEILNPSLVPPFLMDDDHISENVRLEYRFLDLRRPQMQRNLRLRYKTALAVRQFLDRHGFIDIETPMLTRSTPEGARDYLVPSRVHAGEFFALPQSPQLFKQLLMISGFDRYYQIVKCFRDEDLRADRQPEFTQIDIETSFLSQQEITELMEELICAVFHEAAGIALPRPFPRMAYDEAMTLYGSDKPDLRVPLKLAELTDVMKNAEFKVFREAANLKDGRVAALAVPNGGELSRKEIDDYTEFVKIYGAQGLAWIKVKEDGEWQSPIVKFFSEDEKKGLAERLGMVPGDIVFFQAAPEDVTNASLGNLRLKLGERFGLIDEKAFAPLWVTDFPLLEYDPEDKRWVAKHHPFTSPQPGQMDTIASDPAGALARAYDLVLNGSEIGGGSIRIHTPAAQKAMFQALGIDEAEAEEKFGFLIEALKFGAPPHGGIAFGLDRIIMILTGAKSIRDVIAFPKTQKGACLMSEAPSPVDNLQLRELGIQLREKAEEKKSEA